jgi:RNA polymerase sigma-70 factor (ECF subfamily)
MVDDRVLVRRVAAGDRGAVRLLYERYADRLFRFALVRLGDRQAAEDAVQETMLAAWQGADGFRDESRVDTWLFGICRNKVLDHVRREARRREGPSAACSTGPAPDAWGSGPAPDPPGSGGAPDPGTSAVEFWEAFGRLDQDDRELLLLVFYCGFTQREVAQSLGVPVGTVKSRVYHARRRLGRALADRADGAAGEAAGGKECR